MPRKSLQCCYIFIFSLLFSDNFIAAKAEWSVLTYIEADNSLAPFALYNIQDMQKVGSTKDVNILVQWDQPKSKKTWRYKITQNGKIEDASLSQPMGVNPTVELATSMQWIADKYSANHYMLNLWNHGNGVLDKSGRNHFVPTSWIEIPGYSFKNNLHERGILYDDSQDTFLDNQGLTTACSNINLLLWLCYCFKSK
jgi:hypothetical protein